MEIEENNTGNKFTLWYDFSLALMPKMKRACDEINSLPCSIMAGIKEEKFFKRKLWIQFIAKSDDERVDELAFLEAGMIIGKHLYK